MKYIANKKIIIKGAVIDKNQEVDDFPDAKRLCELGYLSEAKKSKPKLRGKS